MIPTEDLRFLVETLERIDNLSGAQHTKETEEFKKIIAQMEELDRTIKE